MTGYALTKSPRKIRVAYGHKGAYGEGTLYPCASCDHALWTRPQDAVRLFADCARGRAVPRDEDGFRALPRRCGAWTENGKKPCATRMGDTK